MMPDDATAELIVEYWGYEASGRGQLSRPPLELGAGHARRRAFGWLRRDYSAVADAYRRLRAMRGLLPIHFLLAAAVSTSRGDTAPRIASILMPLFRQEGFDDCRTTRALDQLEPCPRDAVRFWGRRREGRADEAAPHFTIALRAAG